MNFQGMGKLNSSMQDEAFGVPEWLEWGQRDKVEMNRTVIFLWSSDNGKQAVAWEGVVKNNETWCVEVIPAIENEASASRSDLSWMFQRVY